MDDKKIQSILQDALEEDIPSSEIKLWPAVKASLVAGRTFQQGEIMNSIPSRRISPVALIVLVVGTLMAVAAITPQGRAFAQSVLQFFTRAESDTFPLSPSQIVTDPGVTSAPTAEPPSQLISVGEAEVQVGFDAAELPLVPDGFNYLGARVYGHAISIEYEAEGGGGNLIIMQSQEGFLQSDWDQVPAEAITPVQVGGTDAEFAQGTFVVLPNATSATWNSDAPILRLRWIEDGIWFEIAKFGDVESIEYLDRAGLIELAERLTTDPFPWNLEDVEAQAGFDVLEPEVLPRDMMFLGSSLDPFAKTTFLSFGYSETERGILIQQQPVSSPETCDLCALIGASAEVETAQVRSTIGEYVIGVWKADDAGNWVWEYEPFLQRLRWQENGMAFEILYMGPPEQMTRDVLVAIAESME